MWRVKNESCAIAHSSAMFSENLNIYLHQMGEPASHHKSHRAIQAHNQREKQKERQFLKKKQRIVTKM